MAKTSVLARPLPNSSLPRNTFERSFFTRLNWSAGQLIPVFCKDVPEGSSGEINRSVFMRTNAVNTAAFPKMDTHIDFYKVPKKFLMTRYEEWKTNIDDLNSTSLYDGIGGASVYAPPTTRVPLSLPYTTVGEMALALANTTWSDDLGFSWASGCKKLMDLLDYNDQYAGIASTDPRAAIQLNTLRIQAYQKVYYDHYRNSAYESNQPFAYNADVLYTNSDAGMWKYGIANFQELWKMRYVNYRKDFFMNIYPALNYVVSSPDGTDWSIPSTVVDVRSTPASAVFGVQAGSSSHASVQMTTSGGTASNSKLLTVQTIRAAFALDKLQRLSAYAPKHVKDQIEARFGVKKPNSSTYESTYLGSFKNDVVVGEVTSTADTQNSGNGLALGAIGGRGVGAEGSGKSIHYEITGQDGDCIIIGMMYTLARSAYDSWRLDAHNFKFLREDVFQPEFMDLGLRPIMLKEVFWPTTPGGPSLAQLNTILGYVPRDQEYKLEVDENHGEFRNGQSLSAFVNHTNVNTVQRGHTLGTPGVNLTFFKVSPSDLDSVFVQAFVSTTPSTDQFFGEFNFKFVSRQNMSVHGQPRL